MQYTVRFLIHGRPARILGVFFAIVIRQRRIIVFRELKTISVPEICLNRYMSTSILFWSRNCHEPEIRGAEDNLFFCLFAGL